MTQVPDRLPVSLEETLMVNAIFLRSGLGIDFFGLVRQVDLMRLAYSKGNAEQFGKAASEIMKMPRNEKAD